MESLYSNIDLEDALLTICDFMKDRIHFKEITITGFYNILKLILDNNVFKYKNYFYIQIKGIAMGSKCAPSIANIYLVVYSVNSFKYISHCYIRDTLIIFLHFLMRILI